MRLFTTLRHLGGSLADAQAVCYFDRVFDTTIAAKLRDLDVSVRLVAPVEPRSKVGNQQVMLEDENSFDWLVALDSDMVVASDFSHELTGDAVALAPADHSLASVESWKTLFGAFGLRLPPVRYRSVCHNAICPPYFDTGILLVPSSLVGELRSKWTHWLVAVLDGFDRARLPTAFRDQRWAANKIALSLALADGSIPHRALPISMDAHTHPDIHPLFGPDHFDPAIVHYHHRVDERGLLVQSGQHGTDKAVNRINTLLARRVGVDGAA